MEEIKEIAKILFQYGGTVVMAVLFVWLFIQERKDLEKEREIIILYFKNFQNQITILQKV